MSWFRRREKIYIIPTRMGGYFITVTLIILLVGSGYSNNLVNILAFFMLSLVFVGMVLTHLQLKDLSVVEILAHPAFAGEHLWGEAIVKNPNAVERWGMRVEFSDLKTVPESAVHVLQARQTTRVNWPQIAGQRGLHRLKKAEMNSIFPLGLFYAWKPFPVNLNYWVYPELKGDRPMPTALQAGEDEALRSTQAGSGDDFRGHRKYDIGDSSRHIDWKAHARGRPLLVKELNEGDPPDRVFDYADLDGSVEERLSQLAVWVKQAFERNLGFVLKLPGQEDLAGRGELHARRCFESLALFRGAEGAGRSVE